MNAHAQPPHDIPTEQALLGAVLVHPASLAVISGIIGPDSFFEPLHGKLLEAIVNIASEGREPTPVLLGPLFRDEPSVGELTVAQYLGRLAAAACSIMAAKSYAESIRDLYCKRQLAELGRQLQGLANDPLSSVPDAAQIGLSGLDDIMAVARPSRLHPAMIGDAANQLLDDIENDDAPPPVKSGLADLDRLIGGFRRDEFTVAAGRTSMGKSTGLTEFAMNGARAGHGVMLFSLEMSKAEVSARCLSSAVWNSKNPIAYTDILNGSIADPWRLREAAARLGELPFRIDDQSGLTVSEIGVRARRYAADLERKGKRLDLIIVDHLGKVKASKRYAGDKTNETGEVSGALAELAKQLGCAVVAASQLNREVEKRAEKRPELSDLRNSGDIEQDAHVVMFFYRPSYYLDRTKHDNAEAEAARLEASNERQNVLEIIVAKNRNGPVGIAECYIDVASNAVRNLVRTL